MKVIQTKNVGYFKPSLSSRTNAPRDSQQLIEKYHEQLLFLRNSAKLYDAGSYAEAIRLATTMRVLFKHRGENKAVLNQIESHEELDFLVPKFLDTAFNFHQMPLVLICTTKNGAEIVPTLDDEIVKKKIDFDSWWNGIILRLPNGRRVSRALLIESVADREGGTHLDPRPSDFIDQISKFGLGWHFEHQGSSVPAKYIIHASMRQIAHETLRTLDMEYHCEPDTRVGTFVSNFTKITFLRKHN